MTADSLTPKQRSLQMARVRSKDTKPEMLVRRLVFGMGYRYRLHVKDLPGSPDLVFSSRKKIVFVHGCFFHRHKDCTLARVPKSNRKFWIPKLEGNRLRDFRNLAYLKRSGWKVLIIWECELKDKPKLRARLKTFLRV